jgi:endo-alpha-1,4-polygalactosaminidase (GH114 family)
MNKIIKQIICAALILVCCMQVAFAQMPSSNYYGKVPMLNQYSRPCFWYGAVNSTNIASLKKFDLVVLEPTLRVVNVGANQFYMESLTAAQVQELKRGLDGILGTSDDVLVLAYISVGEMLSTTIPGSSGHMTIQKGKDLGLLPSNYSGPSGPVKGPNPWDFKADGSYQDQETTSGNTADGTYDDGYQNYTNINIASDYSSYGSRLKWRNQGYMPWYMDQQGATADWVTDSRYLYGGYWKKGENVVDVNKTYGGGYINGGDPAWKKFVTFQIDKLEKDIGFDGVFLDTYDTPDPVGGAGPTVSWGPRGNFGWTAKGMVELIEAIKAVDPAKVVASNRGYWMMNPDEGTSQFADRYRHAMNIFVTETWYHNPYITSGSMFYDENPAFASNWNTNPASADYRVRDNFGGFWKDYMNAQASNSDGFNTLIIDFQVTVGAKMDKWMNQVTETSDYMGYPVVGSNNFNAGIYEGGMDWLNAKGYASADMTNAHPNLYSGFGADSKFTEWNSETPIYNNASPTNGKAISKIYVKFVNDKFFMMIESINTLNLSAEQILFDYDQNGTSGWPVAQWGISADSRIYFENAQQVGLFPYKGPSGESFGFPNAITNRAWPVKVAYDGAKRWELEFEKDFIFGPANQGKEIWTWFRQANFGGSAIKFTVPSDGPVTIPSAPSALSATAASASQINLSWTDNSSNEDGFRIERSTGTSTTYTEIATVGANTTSYSNTALTASTQYNYRVRSYNSAGSSSYTSVASATTTSGATVPAAPSGLGVAVASSTQLNLSWTDNATNETGFRIERSTGTSTTYTEIATVGANVVTYSNTALTASTQYNYRVRAYNATGNSAYTAVVSATTSSGATAPAAPSALAVSVVSSSQLNLSWADNASNETGFRIERSTGTSTTYTEITTVGANITTYSNTGLTASTQYNYRVRAYNATGNSAYTSVVSATTQGTGGTTITVNGDLADWSSVSAVTTATGQTALSMKVFDDASKVYFGVAGSAMNTNYQIFIDTDNNPSTGYQDTRFTSSGANYMIENGSLFQSTGTGWAWSQVAAATANLVLSKNASATELSLSKAALGTLSATIKVAYLDLNTSYVLVSKLPSTGGYASYTIASGTVVPPAAPTALTTSAVSSTQINLSWTDNSTNESGFRIERSTGTSTTYTEIATTGAGVNTYSNTGLTASTQYNYRVRAYNSAGNSVYTGLSSATTPGSSTITIDGNLAEWSGIPTIATATSQTTLSLKVYNNSTTLYFGVSGSGMSTTHHQIFIDKDNNAATGFQDTRFTSSGADYMIENGGLFQSTGTGWAWSGVTATIQQSKNASATELSINRSALVSMGSTIRVAYLDLNSSFVLQSQLPASGAYASYTIGTGGRQSTHVISLDEDGMSEEWISAYPNPVTKKQLTVRSEKTLREMRIIHSNGTEVFSKSLPEKEELIDTQNWASGLYMIKVITAENEMKVIKIMK